MEFKVKTKTETVKFIFIIFENRQEVRKSNARCPTPVDRSMHEEVVLRLPATGFISVWACTESMAELHELKFAFTTDLEISLLCNNHELPNKYRWRNFLFFLPLCPLEPALFPKISARSSYSTSAIQKIYDFGIGPIFLGSQHSVKVPISTTAKNFEFVLLLTCFLKFQGHRREQKILKFSLNLSA